MGLYSRSMQGFSFRCRAFVRSKIPLARVVTFRLTLGQIRASTWHELDHVLFISQGVTSPVVQRLSHFIFERSRARAVLRLPLNHYTTLSFQPQRSSRDTADAVNYNPVRGKRRDFTFLPRNLCRPRPTAIGTVAVSAALRSRDFMRPVWPS